MQTSLALLNSGVQRVAKQLHNGLRAARHFSGGDALRGKHPYTSRTRWLSLKRPMILCWRRYGKVGGCQIYKKT